MSRASSMRHNPPAFVRLQGGISASGKLLDETCRSLLPVDDRGGGKSARRENRAEISR